MSEPAEESNVSAELPEFRIRVSRSEIDPGSPAFGSLPPHFAHCASLNSVASFKRDLSINSDSPLMEDDELCRASPCERVFAVTEQLVGFLSRFSLLEKQIILEPFFQSMGSTPCSEASLSEQPNSEESRQPHVDEARQFVATYLASCSEADGWLALDRLRTLSWGPADDSGEEASRDFLNMRRKARTRSLRLRTAGHVSWAATSLWALQKSRCQSRLVKASSISKQAAPHELKDVVATFQRYDLKGSGTISQSHLAWLCTELNPMLARKDVESMLAQYWLQEPVDFSEFAAWLCSTTESVVTQS